MDLIYSAGDYEANLRPVSVVDYGIKETQQMIDDYLVGVGLTDTQAEWYQQRFDININIEACYNQRWYLTKRILTLVLTFGPRH